MAYYNYLSIKSAIDDIVASSTFTGSVYLLGGIVVNGDYDHDDYFYAKDLRMKPNSSANYVEYTLSSKATILASIVYFTLFTVLY